MLPIELGHLILDIIHQDSDYDINKLIDIFGCIMNLDLESRSAVLCKKYADYRYKFAVEYSIKIYYYGYQLNWYHYIMDMNGESIIDIFDIIYSFIEKAVYMHLILLNMILILYKYEHTTDIIFKKRVIRFVQKLCVDQKFINIYGNRRTHSDDLHLNSLVLAGMLRILSEYYYILISDE